MTTISIQVDDKLIDAAGAQTIHDFLKDQIERYRFRLLSDSIAQSVKQSGIDLEEELLAAKGKAWKKYKKEYLKDILK
jgi:hypothetical protein